MPRKRGGPLWGFVPPSPILSLGGDHIKVGRGPPSKNHSTPPDFLLGDMPRKGKGRLFSAPLPDTFALGGVPRKVGGGPSSLDLLETFFWGEMPKKGKGALL